MLFLPPIGLMVVTAFRLLSGDEPVLLKLFSPYQSTPLVTACAVLAVLATVRRFEFVPVLLLGAALEAIRVALLLSEGRNVIESWSTFGQGFWYASIAVALWHIVQSSPAQRWQEVDRALLRVALPLAVSLALFGLQLTVLNIPTTFDNVLYAFDGLLGPPVATFVAGLCRNHQALRVLAIIAYQSLWLMMSVFVFAQCQTDQRMAVRLMSCYILLGIVGWLLYFVLPAIDPGAVFWDVYGDQLPSPNEVSLDRLAVHNGHPRNAMPSLHMSWALLLAMEARRMGKAWASIGLAYVFIIAFSTFGVREHYLIDLVVAVPFTVSMYAVSRLFCRRQGRTELFAAAAGGAAMTALLLVTIRFGTEALRGAPWVARALVVGAVSLSLVLHFLAERRAPSAAVAALTPPPHGNAKGI